MKQWHNTRNVCRRCCFFLSHRMDPLYCEHLQVRGWCQFFFNCHVPLITHSSEIIFRLQFGASLFYCHVLLIVSFLQFPPSQSRLSLPPRDSRLLPLHFRYIIPTNAQLSSATASLPLRHTISHRNHRNTPVADDSCTGGYLVPAIQQSIHQQLMQFPLLQHWHF